MLVWERNFDKEGVVGSKSNPFEWWTLSAPLYGAHVWKENNRSGWHWKINSIENRVGKRTYLTKEKAMAMCEHEINHMLSESKL